MRNLSESALGRTWRSAEVHNAAAFVQEVELAVELDEFESGARAEPGRARAVSSQLTHRSGERLC